MTEKVILPNTWIVTGKFRHEDYIEDLFFMGFSQQNVTEGVLGAIECCKGAGLPISEKKFMEVLGMQICEIGLLFLKNGIILKLLQNSEEFFNTTKWNTKALEEILKKLVLFLLLRRPLLSIPKVYYEILHAERFIPVPTYKVRRDFQTPT